ncbi:hypothetical protein [Spirosoma sordidisoli]|uniref:Uncharacterized protein n=1 Tax=Spirosoma sordidisoli TaxID=2502893 RepID=A0A4Q2ULA1_9BACT|nr:hypothetical protein [Spirosoma sordidisoli]RYC70094.1 hypothetical protein EQG79_09490 [Spirosoma sordidisoli]
MTRYEQLQRIASDKRTEPRHVALFHVVTECWVNAGKPQRAAINHADTMRLCRIRGKATYYKTLHELAAFGYLIYVAATSRYGKSTISFASIGSACVPMRHTIGSIAERMKPVKACIGSAAVRMSQTIGSETVPMKPFIGSVADLMKQAHRFSISTDRSDSSSSGPVFSLSTSAQLLSPRDNITLYNTVDTAGQVVNMEKGHVMQGKRGTGGKTEKRTRTTNQVGSTFARSELADFENFCAALAGNQTAASADLSYYYQKVAAWRNRDGTEPVRGSWKASAITIMLNDYREGKLVTSQTKQANVSSSHSNQPKNGRSVIEPAAKRVFSW